MSRPQEPHRAFFPLGNPFKMRRPKVYMSPKLLELLNKFEVTLAARMRKLKPEHHDSIFSLPWMILAMQLLSETHSDIKSLITELELPVHDWDDKWIDVYLDNSVKLLDVCIAFSSELSRLSQGQLLLHCVLRNLDGANLTKVQKAKSSIDSWRQHIGMKNPRVENCSPIVDKLLESLELPKVKDSAKGKVLMQAMYGVKVQTLFVCNAFISAFTGSNKKLTDLQVAGTHLWADSFKDLQNLVNGEIRRLISGGRVLLLKELEQVDTILKESYPMIEAGKEPVSAEAFQNRVTDLQRSSDKLSSGLDLLAKEVDGFFQIVLSGRDALLCNLRLSSSSIDSPKKYKVEDQVFVRPFDVKTHKSSELSQKIEGNRMVKADEESRDKIDSMGNGKVETDSNNKQNDGHGIMKQDADKLYEMASSFYSISIAIGTGGYHFQLGPIGYVDNWSFGVPYTVPFGQPYVVVSPYSQPNAPPGSNVPQHQQPKAVYTPSQQVASGSVSSGANARSSP